MANSTAQDRQARLTSPDRVLAFTDGVFAIVITILVLEIAVPPNLTEGSLREVLEDLRPTMVAWVVSFLITGMYWVSHRDLFARVRVVNRDLVWLNLLFLLPTCLIPFAASVLGEYADAPLALHLYGVVVIAVSLMRIVLYLYVLRRPELTWDGASPASRQGLLITALPIPVYLLAMAVADVSTSASVALYLVLPLLYFVAITVLRERPRTRSEADQFS